MHVDESQLSLTLALNELHNYAGGGTYVNVTGAGFPPRAAHRSRRRRSPGRAALCATDVDGLDI